MRSWGKENFNQNILYANCFSTKMQIKNFLWKSVAFTIILFVDNFIPLLTQKTDLLFICSCNCVHMGSMVSNTNEKRRIFAYVNRM